MRSITVERRRAVVQRRHLLAGEGTSPEQVAKALVCLHSTDPATVFLSALERGRDLTIDDLQAAMYERRTLVRWLAMRRTLFLVPRDDVPMVQAAASTPLAATLRKQLVSRLTRNGTEPPIEGDAGEWLTDVENGVHEALLARGTATGQQLGLDEPRARSRIVPRAKSDLPQNVTSTLLALMSAEGRIVRGQAAGAWTTRLHRWEPPELLWPGGMPVLDTPTAQADLVRAYLRAFGPVPVGDVEWWTGWGKAVVRAALSRLPLVEVDLAGEVGIALDDGALDAELDAAVPDPALALLPCLDPTPMGWKARDWFLSIDPGEVFDRNGNIGPTVWWNGEVVGGWGVAADGEVRVRLLLDRGAAAVEAAESAAAELQGRLSGAVIKPVFPTRLERALAL